MRKVGRGFTPAPSTPRLLGEVHVAKLDIAVCLGDHAHDFAPLQDRPAGETLSDLDRSAAA